MKQTIKIFNENGKVQVVKVMSNGLKHVLFSNIADGQVATLEIGVPNICVECNLDDIEQ